MSSAIRSIVLGCVSDGRHQPHQHSLPWIGSSGCRHRKVKFGVPLAEAFRGDVIPHQLIDILVYIGREGIGTMDLFRRPGSQADLKVIMKKLSEGQEIALNDYNFYTLASVIKKFLLRIPGGIFGQEVEARLIETLQMDDRFKQLKAIHSIISGLAPAVQQLLALLFGTWFWVVNHSNCKSRSSESVAKSIAGSLFHTCSDDPGKVESAVRILEILINNFGGTDDMFGRENVEFFVGVMRSAGADDLVRSKMSGRTRTTQEDSMHRSITESEFRCHIQPIASSARASLGGSSVEIQLPQSLSFMTSEESLDSSIHRRELNAPYNTHRKLARVSSISAPDVNQDCCYSRPTRYDSVRRRQMLRLKERSCWFLSPSTKDAGTSDAGRSFSISPDSPARHAMLCCDTGSVSCDTTGHLLPEGPTDVERASFSSANVIAHTISENCKEHDLCGKGPATSSSSAQGRKMVQICEKEVEKDWQHMKPRRVH